MKIRFGAGFCEGDAGEYYVYTHSVAGHGVFYVGKGKGYRIGENFRRNSDWLKVADKYGLDKIVRDKLVTNVCEEFAKLLEAELIEKYDMLGIPIVNRLIGCLNYGYTTSFKDKNPGFNKGINHPCADKRTHHFVHKHGEEFVGTRLAFSEKYGIQSKRLFGKWAMRTYFGWRVIECLDKD